MYAKDRTTIIDRREMLRVKLKSLAAEAKIIRKEERRSWGGLRESLHLHRINEVRQEARATHLAYGFIRGLMLGQMEPIRYVGEPAWRIKSLDESLFKRVNQLIAKYGPKGLQVTATGALQELKKAA